MTLREIIRLEGLNNINLLDDL